MITCVISAILVRWLTKYSIYTLKLVRKGIDVTQSRQVDLMDIIIVSEAMISNIITVSQHEKIKNVGLLIKTTSHRGFPVVEEKGGLVGIVTRQDVNRALGRGDAEEEVGKIMTRDVTICFPNESLKTALHKMAVRNIGRMPVVERDHQEHIIGLITRKSLINAYNRALEGPKNKTSNLFEDS